MIQAGSTASLDYTEAPAWTRRQNPGCASPRSVAWLLGHSAATLLIPGTRDLAHLADNVAVARIELDQEAMTAFDALAQDAPA